MKNIEEYANKLKNVNLVKSYNTNETLNKSLLFYHIKKCGGIYFRTQLSNGAKVINNRTNPIGSIHMNNLKYKDYSEQLKSFLQREDTQRIVPFTTMQPYGIHKKFKKNFLLTTTIRDPFSRIVSDFTYTYARQGKKAKEKDFNEFLYNITEHNLCTKVLSGSYKKYSVEKAIKNLKKNFHSYVILEDINKLLEYYISAYNMPNVLSEKLNSTTKPKIKEKLLKYKDEIIKLNSLDMELYEYIKNNPRIPKFEASENYNTNTLISLDGTNENSQVKLETNLINTEVLDNYLKLKNPDSLKVFSKS